MLNLWERIPNRPDTLSCPLRWPISKGSSDRKNEVLVWKTPEASEVGGLVINDPE